MIPDLVSIAIPAYKARFLAEAIQSALGQTYSNIELIIVNDCSPEPVGKVVSQFHDPRIRYYANQKNLGNESVVLNWNKCLSLARGEFFVLLCDDDLLKPAFLEKMLALADKYPECNVFRSPTQYSDCSGKIIYATEPWPEYEDGIAFVNAALRWKRKHTITEFMYRTSYIKGKGGYISFPAAYYSDDASIMELSLDNGIASLSGCYVTFRVSGENISSSEKYNKSKAIAAIKYYQWLESFLQGSRISNPLDIGNEIEYAIFNYLKPCSLLQKLHVLAILPAKYFSLRRRLILACSVLHSKGRAGDGHTFSA